MPHLKPVEQDVDEEVEGEQVGEDQQAAQGAPPQHAHRLRQGGGGAQLPLTEVSIDRKSVV